MMADLQQKIDDLQTQNDDPRKLCQDQRQTVDESVAALSTQVDQLSKYIEEQERHQKTEEDIIQQSRCRWALTPVIVEARTNNVDVTEAIAAFITKRQASAQAHPQLQDDLLHCQSDFMHTVQLIKDVIQKMNSPE